ncbi:MAG: SulP family inorganic anion transporter, partial [Mycobacterium sp.]|nr:SulP family inorganic anion transporter [Mycobacterium sp.]
RTAVNVRSGARTRVAAITHSVLLLGVVYLATGPVSAIPLSALAGVLMVTSFRMISARTVRKILRSTRSDAAIFVLTAVVTVCFDLIEAVEIGIAVAAFFALRTVARRSSVVRQQLPGPPQAGDERIALLQLDGAMFFGAAERISNAITDAEHPEVSVVIIRMSQLGMLDATGAHTLAEIAGELEARGITVIIKGVQPEHMALLANMGIFDALRHENHLIDSLDDAVAHARSHAAVQTRSSPSAR